MLFPAQKIATLALVISLGFTSSTARPQGTDEPAPSTETEAAADPSGAAKQGGDPLIEYKKNTPAKELERQNKKFVQLESFSRTLNLLEALYVDEKTSDSEALIEKAIKGLVSNLDPHTSYLAPQQLRDLTTDTSGRFGGIGVVLSQKNNRLEVVEVIPDSPAAKAGIQPGDLIRSVEKTVVTPENMENVLTRLKGLPGTRVEIEIVPAAANQKASSVQSVEATKPKTRTLKLTRETIRTRSVSHAKLADGLVYVRLAVFQEDTGEQLDRALKFHESQNGGKLSGLILDLRSNPGGLLDQAVRVTDLFIDSGIIVSTVGRDKERQEVEYATKRTTHPNMPLIVLVNETSASASEIVAGALQDHERAIVMGTQSFGKGSVQSIIPLPNGGGLKMTIARYYTPKGRSIQAKGITPDIPLSSGQAAEKGRTPQTQNDPGNKKESDLEGHIEGADLESGKVSDGVAPELETWPPALQADPQVRAAFLYMKSWSRFQNVQKK